MGAANTCMYKILGISKKKKKKEKEEEEEEEASL